MRAKALPARPQASSPLPPGSTVGILGGGQLGRMLALEARRMGYRTVVLDPTAGSPAAQVCDRHVQAPIDDPEAAARLARECDLVTLEWELIPAKVLEAVEAEKPLYPSSKELFLIQDRLRQKEFLAKRGFPQADYRRIDDGAALEGQAREFGFPCLLKRRTHGYDGKGQAKLSSARDVEAAASHLTAPCVLEAWVPYEKELSVILARGRDGGTEAFPVAENVHVNGVLHTTRVPADIPRAADQAARKLALEVAEALGHVGVMAVEMFLLRDGRLLVNEVAPRVHNSGHYTLGACAVSQFEQHLRAVGGLPLGETALLSPAVMVNLLGDLWAKGEPRWEPLLRRPDLRLHLYGKAKAAPGRKMGHFLLLGPDADRLLAEADALLAGLRRG